MMLCYNLQSSFKQYIIENYILHSNVLSSILGRNQNDPYMVHGGLVIEKLNHFFYSKANISLGNIQLHGIFNACFLIISQFRDSFLF